MADSIGGGFDLLTLAAFGAGRDRDSITGTFGTLDTSAVVLPFPLGWDFSKLFTTASSS